MRLLCINKHTVPGTPIFNIKNRRKWSTLFMLIIYFRLISYFMHGSHGPPLPFRQQYSPSKCVDTFPRANVHRKKNILKRPASYLLLRDYAIKGLNVKSEFLNFRPPSLLLSLSYKLCRDSQEFNRTDESMVPKTDRYEANRYLPPKKRGDKRMSFCCNNM